MESQLFNVINEQTSLKCVVEAYPEPSVTWYFKPCQAESCEYEEEPESYRETNGHKLTSYLIRQPTSMQSGYVSCVASNWLGEGSDTVRYYVSGRERLVF